MLNKILKRLLQIIGVLLCLALLILAILFIRQAVTDHRINDEISSIYTDPKYQKTVRVEGLHPIQQEISCGYAILEILSNWQNQNITENSLWIQNNQTISTAMGNGFMNEMNKQFPQWAIIKQMNLQNTHLIDRAYDQLASGMPVPFELAALHTTQDGQSVWTLHFAILVSMDIPGDAITVINPYGYEESYTVSELLRATRYDSFERMPWFFRVAFAAGVFSKNTIYTRHDQPVQ